jgi:fumarate hydratase class I
MTLLEITMKIIELPMSESVVRSLKVGDPVALNGVMVTGRDTVHKWLVDTFIKKTRPAEEDDFEVYEAIKPLLKDSAIYHCGPVVAGLDTKDYRFVAAGPTTSIREEPYQGEIIRRYGVRAVIGKGGMGAKTLAALKESGAVYLSAIGGAAQFYARCVENVDGVSLMEFGVPEAMWHLRVRDFPCIVTMDSHGNSLHKEVEAASAVKLAGLSEMD